MDGLSFLYRNLVFNVPVHGRCGERRLPKVQPSTRPEIEPGSSWLAVRDITNCAIQDKMKRINLPNLKNKPRTAKPSFLTNQPKDGVDRNPRPPFISQIGGA